MLQKPFLSRYEFNLPNNRKTLDCTVKTKALESSDDDEHHLNSTGLTEATETSDDDEYYDDVTIMTRAREDSDPDFFLIYKDN